ncbi:hypothetical protein COCOBI_11-2730 [Coccomyxa sp. Obi]|nr:hypothetical protein COCOBI_11-2730 [Coccomyxa sp. Obi]
MLKRTHSERGTLEVDDGRFIKKVPQTSVAPTFKLTLPSEFVISNLAHLIDQSFDLTDKEGKDVWRVALLPRRNKSKYEYTLQGWKAFALSHSVQTGDRLQIELLPDSRRMRADIVKRAELQERVASEPGPESPTLPDMASAAKRLHAAGEPTTTSSEAEQQPDKGPGSGGASWSSGAAAEPQPPLWPADAAAGAAERAGTNGHHSKFEALHALSGALAQHLHHCSAPGQEPRARGSGAALLRSSFSAFAEANRSAEQAPQENGDHMSGRRQRRSAFGSGGRDCSDDEQAASMEPYTPSYERKSRSTGGITAHHPKRQRTVFASGASGHGADRAWSATARDLDMACTSGMALLSSAAELDAGGDTYHAHQPEAKAEEPTTQTPAPDQPQGHEAGVVDADTAAKLEAAAEVLEAQTSRGLMVVSALLGIAGRLVAPGLLAGAAEDAAAELAALHAELKEHTNSVLDAMWHMRNLPKAWQGRR